MLQFIYNLRMSTRLIASFLAGASLALLLGWTGMYWIARINTMAATMYHSNMQGQQHIARANQQLLLAARAIRIAALSPTQMVRDEQLQAVSLHLAKLDQALVLASSVFENRLGKPIVQDAMNTVHEYRDGINQVAMLIRQEPLQPLKGSVAMLYEKMVPLADKIDFSLDNLTKLSHQQAQGFHKQTHDIHNLATLIMIGLTAAIVLSILALGIALTRNLRNKLGAEPDTIIRLANTIAQGNLNQNIKIHGMPQHSVLAALIRMNHSLKTYLSTARLKSNQLAKLLKNEPHNLSRVQSCLLTATQGLDHIAEQLDRLKKATVQAWANTRLSEVLQIHTDLVELDQTLRHSMKHMEDAIADLDYLSHKATTLAKTMNTFQLNDSAPGITPGQP